MWQLLVDYMGIQRRSVIGIVRIVRILCSQRARVTLVWGSRMRIGLRPRLGHRRSMDHRTIHGPNCCEDECVLEERNSPSWFYSKAWNSALTPKPIDRQTRSFP